MKPTHQKICQWTAIQQTATWGRLTKHPKLPNAQLYRRHVKHLLYDQAVPEKQSITLSKPTLNKKKDERLLLVYTTLLVSIANLPVHNNWTRGEYFTSAFTVICWGGHFFHYSFCLSLCISGSCLQWRKRCLRCDAQSGNVFSKINSNRSVEEV